MDYQIIIPIIVAIIAAAPGIWAAIAQFRKADNDLSTAVQDAAIDLIAPLREEINRLRARVGELECSNAEKDKQIKELKVSADTVKELKIAVMERDGKIAELQTQVKERDIKIDLLQTELDSLRDRLEIVERRKGNTQPLPKKTD